VKNCLSREILGKKLSGQRMVIVFEAKNFPGTKSTLIFFDFVTFGVSYLVLNDVDFHILSSW
jgi:hypothetical protein